MRKMPVITVVILIMITACAFLVFRYYEDNYSVSGEDMIISVLCEYAKAQRLYKSRGLSQACDPEKVNWFATSLSQLIEGSGTKPDGATFSWELLLDYRPYVYGKGGMPYCGYFILPGPVTKDSFSMFGIPSPEMSDFNTFYIDETGSVKKKKLGGNMPRATTRPDSSWVVVANIPNVHVEVAEQQEPE